MDETHSSYKKILGMTILAIIGVVAVALAMLVGNQNKQAANTAVVPGDSSNTTSMQANMLALSVSPAKVSMQDNITVAVSGNTSASVVGYDAVVTFDPRLISYVSSSSVLDSFQVVATAETGKVILTGSKKLSESKDVAFANTELATLVFKAKSKGSADFGLEYVSGATNESNIMDTNSKDVLSTVAGATVTIE